MCLDHIHPSLPSYLFLITHWVRLVLSLYLCVWGHSLELAGGTIPLKKTDSPLGSNHSLPIVGLLGSPHPCLKVHWLDLVQAVITSVSSCVQWACHVQKALFCPSPLYNLWLLYSLCLLSKNVPWNLHRGVMYMFRLWQSTPQKLWTCFCVEIYSHLS